MDRYRGLLSTGTHHLAHLKAVNHIRLRKKSGDDKCIALINIRRSCSTSLPDGEKPTLNKVCVLIVLVSFASLRLHLFIPVLYDYICSGPSSSVLSAAQLLHLSLERVSVGIF